MALCIKEKIFSWSQAYTVFDENGQPKYTVKGEVFSLGHKIHIYDLNNKEVAFIDEKIWTILKKFKISINGEFKGMVNEKFAWFHPKYQVDFMDLQVEGDIFEWNYQMLRKGIQVASIQRKVLSWANTFYLDYSVKEDEVAVLALAIAIDAAHSDDEDAAMMSAAYYH